MNDKTALKIIEACIDEMYKQSIPPTTWKALKEKYGDTTKSFYDKHSLSEQDYIRIKEKYCKKLDKYYQRQLDWFLLDYAPSFKEKDKK